MNYMTSSFIIMQDSIMNHRNLLRIAIHTYGDKYDEATN